MTEWVIVNTISRLNLVDRVQIADDPTKGYENEEDKKPAENIQALQKQLNDLLEYYGIPGMSVAIIENNQITLLKYAFFITATEYCAYD